jgi:signal recognition particle subunit SRP54
MVQIKEMIQPDDICFVMDSHMGQSCFEQAKAFKETTDIGSVIVTKLDGHAKGGGALSAVAATGAPIKFLGTGEHLNEFEIFDAESFVSKLLGLGDMKGLFRMFGETVDMEKQPQMLERIMKGRFSLRDMYDQMSNISKMGPLSQVMGMIPGMGKLLNALIVTSMKSENDNHIRCPEFKISIHDDEFLYCESVHFSLNCWKIII